MAKRKRTRKSKHLLERVFHPNAAGIDIGAEEVVVAVPPERDENAVRTFATFTPDLYELRDWLLDCGIETVAMESTGNYWIATYQILEDAGIEVLLVNARHVKAVPGKKTDVCDAQWLQQLHSAGLLRGSFRPANEIVALRYVMRHRSELVQSSSRQLLLMQKVLTEMNIKLHQVFSDIDGMSSMAIIEAILAGERDGEKLWTLRHPRCKTTKRAFLAAVQGDWREEYLFVLGQCVESWKGICAQREACDEQIAQLIAAVSVEEAPADQLPPVRKQMRARKNEPAFELRAEGWRFYGVDLSAIDGVGPNCLAVLMSELGTRAQILKSFRSASAFASWLGLCPDNRISGGKVLKSKTRAVANRVARQLRLAVYCLERSHSELGRYTRRMKGRLGKAEGITAAAHKLARIIFSLIRTRQAYDETIAFKPKLASKARRLKQLQKQAAEFGMVLTAA